MQFKKTTRLNLLWLNILLATAGWLTTSCAGESSKIRTERHAATDTKSILAKKNFYLLTALEQDEYKIILTSKVLDEIGNRKVHQVRSALQTCNDAGCLGAALQWQPSVIDSVSDELVRLYGANEKMKNLASLLKKKGDYNLFVHLDDTAFLRKVWENVATGMNHVITVYMQAASPRYPAIDAISFATDDPGFVSRCKDAIKALLPEENEHAAFFRLPYGASLAALLINGRDEAARYEPMNEKVNAPAYKKAQETNWSSYPYSAILVPGQGPDSPGVRLDSMGAVRCRLVVERYKKGQAPFIIVSGGHVHPNKTPYSEAVEMKKYMVQELNIPEDVVFIEPHARHTTTNLRNAARIIYHSSMPENKPILIVTDPKQSNYILTMDKRCMDELGYLPYLNLKRLTEYENEYYPVNLCLQANPLDPLDP